MATEKKKGLLKKTGFFFIVSLFLISPLFLTSILHAQERDKEKTISIEQEQKEDKRDEAKSKNLLQKVNGKLAGILFYDVARGSIKAPKYEDGKPVINENGTPEMRSVGVPIIIVVLLFGGLFFTTVFKFINIRGFFHSINVIRGKYDNPEDKGEISHFRALTSALSATVGLGNIAGVAIAITTGGPGAVFWMMSAAIFGMTSKFSSCTLSQMYRKVNKDGSVSGGPMYYIDLGFRDISKSLIPIGKVLAIMYAIMLMSGSIGGGNMFQSNQVKDAIVGTISISDEFQSLSLDKQESIKAKYSNVVGVVLATLVGVVVLGGIRRIGAVTSRVVPFMCCLYVLTSLFIIFSNFSKLPDAINLIFSLAFTKNAIFGGAIGVLVCGIQRASFSNEAGLGSAAVVHAAAKTKEPVREGIVAMIGPFIDTIIVCFMTAMVVIITGAWNDPQLTGSTGVVLTSAAFGSQISWFPNVLTVCICLFAFSTMLAWCYYGERGWIYVMDHFGDGFGHKTLVVFRIIFVIAIYVGATNQLDDVVLFTDLTILSMSFPNIIASVFLFPQVRKKLNDYWSRYKKGEMKTY